MNGHIFQKAISYEFESVSIALMSCILITGDTKFMPQLSHLTEIFIFHSVCTDAVLDMSFTSCTSPSVFQTEGCDPMWDRPGFKQGYQRSPVIENKKIQQHFKVICSGSS